MGCACKKITNTLSENTDNTLTQIEKLYDLILKISFLLLIIIMLPFIILLLVCLVISNKTINISLIIDKIKNKDESK